MSDPVLIALILVVGAVVSIIAWKAMEIGKQSQRDDRSEGAGNKRH